MNVVAVFRYTILVISLAAMVLGILVIVGVLVPRYFPDQYRIVIGVVILLYGLYRFVVTYFQRSRE
jgi:hypothetical protein